MESPYNIALLLYEYCIENEFIKPQHDQFVDRILFKSIVYSIASADENSNKFMDEIVVFVRPGLFINSDLNHTKENSYVLNSQDSQKCVQELNHATYEILSNLFAKEPLKATHLIELIFKYNRGCQHLFLKVHLSAINKCLANFKHHGFSDNFNTLLNTLSIYELNPCQSMIEQCFKEICNQFNSLWSDDLPKLDENFRLVYSALLAETNLFELFSRTHYELDRQYNDDTYPLLSIIKAYSNKESCLWRKLFLFCLMEKKVLLKSLIVG